MAEMLEIVDILDDEDEKIIPLAFNASDRPKGKMVSVQVSQIVVPLERAGDPVKASFVESIGKFTQLQPIRVREADEGYELIDGWRRLSAAKLLGHKTIDAVIEKREATETQDLVLGLVANFNRSENFIGSARRIWAILDAGVDEKRLAGQAGLALAKVRQLRDMRKLRPELIEAAEAGAMSSWSAGMGARLNDEQQQFLVDQLEANGKVIKDDIEEARRVGRQQAAASLPDSLFSTPDLMEGEVELTPQHQGYSDDDFAGNMASENALVRDENGPQSDETYEKVVESVTDANGKVSRKGRYALVSARVNAAKAEMLKVKAPRTEDEAHVLDQINDLLDRLFEMSEGE